MRKAVVISSNKNPNYLFYVPIVTWAWKKLGWECIFMSPASSIRIVNLVKENIQYASIFSWVQYLFDYKEETICQLSRLYAADYPVDYSIIMTSDSDMMPLSNYWNPKEDEITCYGRDLTDYHYPICYISMNKDNWRNVMKFSGNFYNDIKRDLKDREDVNSKIPSEVWVTDQNLITEKLIQHNLTRVDRGIDHTTGYPKGRVDRSAWERSLIQKERIDAHLFREGWKDENWTRIMSLIKECLNPTEEEINWLENYRNEFIGLL